MLCSCFKPSVLEQNVMPLWSEPEMLRSNFLNVVGELPTVMNSIEIEPISRIITINMEFTPAILPVLIPLITVNSELATKILPTLLPLVIVHPELATVILQNFIPVIYTLPQLAPVVLPTLLLLLEKHPKSAPKILPTLIRLIELNLERAEYLRRLPSGIRLAPNVVGERLSSALQEEEAEGVGNIDEDCD